MKAAKRFADLRIGYVVKMFPRLSETFILNEMLELERGGAEITIFSAKRPNEGRFHPQLARLQARVHYLDELDPKRWAVWIGRLWPVLEGRREHIWKLLDTALTEQNPARVDLIWSAASIAATALEAGIGHLHAHFASLPSTLAYFASQISGLPFTFTAHAKDIYVYGPDEHLLREKLSAAARVITVTHFNKRHLLQIEPAIDEGRIEVIYNGIDLDFFRPSADTARDPDTILAVGRLVPKKGFHVLIEALGRLAAANRSFTCRIVGEGPELDALRTRSRELGLGDQVHFEGPRHRDEVLEYMRHATLLCLPCVVAADNNVDALPTVLLEAQACGLPVVSTSISGIPEIVDSGRDGELVPPDDPIALGESLIRLLGSAARRESYAVAGRATAEARFSLKNAVGRLGDVFAECSRSHESVKEAGRAREMEDVRLA